MFGDSVMAGEVPAELGLMLGRLDGKLDGIAGTLAQMNSRADLHDRRLTTIEGGHSAIVSRLDKVEAERSIMVPEFQASLHRMTDMETWRTTVEATTKTTAWFVRVVWALVGTFIVALVGWLVSAYVHTLSAPAVEHRETTRIDTITTPAATGTAH